jgi:hypothetical protein
MLVGLIELVGSKSLINIVALEILSVELDLPLNFHPVAIRVSADVTPFGAG